MTANRRKEILEYVDKEVIRVYEGMVSGLLGQDTVSDIKDRVELLLILKQVVKD